MNRHTAIYVLASRDVRARKVEGASADREKDATVAFTIEERTVIAQRTPEGVEHARWKAFDTGTYVEVFPPGTYRFDSQGPVTLTERRGASCVFVTVTNLLDKDDWPDPPRKIWSTERELKELRVFVIGEPE